jgi:hypothetical protein
MKKKTKTPKRQQFVYMLLSYRMASMRAGTSVNIEIFKHKQDALVQECALKYEGFFTQLERKEVK